MSGFLINPFIYGGAGGVVTSVDFSTSPAQSELDIDLTDTDRVVIISTGLTRTTTGASGGGEINSPISDDGGSTYEDSTGGYYHMGSCSHGGTDEDTAAAGLFLMNNGSDNDVDPVIAEYGGFASGVRTWVQSWRGTGTTNFSMTSTTHGAIATSAATHLRICTNTDFDAGILYIQKIADASTTTGSIDWSVSSPPQAIAVSGKHSLYFTNNAIDAAAATRFTWRYSDDDASTYESNIYSDGFLDNTGDDWSVDIGAARAGHNVAPNVTNAKFSVIAVQGLQADMSHHVGMSYYPTVTSDVWFGASAIPSKPITNIEFDPLFGGSDYNTGETYYTFHGLESYAETKSTLSAASDSTYAITEFNTEATLTCDEIITASDECSIQLDFGAGYVTTAANYTEYQWDATVSTDRTGSWNGFLVTGTDTNHKFNCRFFGLQAGIPTAFVCIAGSPTYVQQHFGIYNATVDAVTNIKLLTVGAETMTGDVQWSQNGYA